MKGIAERLRYFFMGMALLGALAGCDFLMGPQKRESGGGGTVAVTLQLGGGGERAALPQGVIDTLRYEMELRGPDGEVITRSVAPGTATVSIPLVVGLWTVRADAYTPADSLAGTGTVSVTVAPGMGRVIIPMNVPEASPAAPAAPSAPVLPSDKAITVFTITSPAATGVIDDTYHTVAITVPYGTAVTGLTPAITITGASISPAPGISQNFSSPVTYTVTAADGTTQAYTVTVNVALASDKQITGFTIPGVSTETTIDETLKTVVINVPYGTPVTALTPAITITGASISPASGTPQNFSSPVPYTVQAADGTIQAYTVTMNVALASDKQIAGFIIPGVSTGTTIDETATPKTVVINVPYGTALTSLNTSITITGASISPASGISQNFSSPVTYTVTAADSSTETYTVRVNVALNPAKAITAFNITIPGTVTVTATGTVNETAKTVAITVPYLTDVTGLTTSITITGASVNPASGTAVNFTTPQTFTVTAADGNTQNYTVTVNANPLPITYVKAAATGTGDGTSWANASGDLQKMIDQVYAAKQAGIGTEHIVRVAAGTYKPLYKPDTSGNSIIPPSSEERDKTFILRPGVKVLGGYDAGGGDQTETTRTARFYSYANYLTSPTTILPAKVRNPIYETILSGDIDGTSGLTAGDAYHVVLGVDIPDGTTVLDGFTIRGGYADGSGTLSVGGQSINRAYGGGIHNDHSFPVLTNVTITGNNSTNGGGINNNYSSPVLTNVTISGNIASNGGGIINDRSSPVLTGVVISDNSANTGGGGIANYNSSATVLTNVTITGNTAAGTNGRGGIFNTSYSPVQTHVTIKGNHPTATAAKGGGIANASNSHAILTNVTISLNDATGSGTIYGGGIYNTGSSPVLTNVTISGNTAHATTGTNGFGGGIYNTGSSPVLTNVTITGNFADAGNGGNGGGVYNTTSSNAALTNVAITGNKAGSGGGISNSGSSLVLTNVTIAGNAATGPTTGNGGGFYNYFSSPVIRNSIIWGNTAALAGVGIYDAYSSTPEVSNSIVQGGYTGTANSDPGSGTVNSPFVAVGWIDPAGGGWTATVGGDYRLAAAGSPAYNTGIDGDYPDTWVLWQSKVGASVGRITDGTAYDTYVKDALEKDLAGSTRKNGVIDRGAYEK
jgi:hypothetical protein